MSITPIRDQVPMGLNQGRAFPNTEEGRIEQSREHGYESRKSITSLATPFLEGFNKYARQAGNALGTSVTTVRAENYEDWLKQKNTDPAALQGVKYFANRAAYTLRCGGIDNRSAEASRAVFNFMKAGPIVYEVGAMFGMPNALAAVANTAAVLTAGIVRGLGMALGVVGKFAWPVVALGAVAGLGFLALHFGGPLALCMVITSICMLSLAGGIVRNNLEIKSLRKDLQKWVVVEAFKKVGSCFASAPKYVKAAAVAAYSCVPSVKLFKESKFKGARIVGGLHELNGQKYVNVSYKDGSQELVKFSSIPAKYLNEATQLAQANVISEQRWATAKSVIKTGVMVAALVGAAYYFNPEATVAVGQGILDLGAKAYSYVPTESLSNLYSWATGAALPTCPIPLKALPAAPSVVQPFAQAATSTALTLVNRVSA